MIAPSQIFTFTFFSNLTTSTHSIHLTPIMPSVSPHELVLFAPKGMLLHGRPQFRAKRHLSSLNLEGAESFESAAISSTHILQNNNSSNTNADAVCSEPTDQEEGEEQKQQQQVSSSSDVVSSPEINKPNPMIRRISSAFSFLSKKESQDTSVSSKRLRRFSNIEMTEVEEEERKFLAHLRWLKIKSGILFVLKGR